MAGQVGVAAVSGRVGGIYPGPHHRRLMANQVYTGQQRGQRLPVSDVDLVASRRRAARWARARRAVTGRRRAAVRDRRPAAPHPREPMNPAAPVTETLTAAPAGRGLMQIAGKRHQRAARVHHYNVPDRDGERFRGAASYNLNDLHAVAPRPRVLKSLVGQSLRRSASNAINAPLAER